MTREEIRFQVAVSVIQGVLEAKHGVIGEVVPSVAVAESLRIADEFVKQWFKEEEKAGKDGQGWKPSKEQMDALDEYIWAKNPNKDRAKYVISLYHDLKKL